MSAFLAAWVSGLIFATGLAISGMTRPAKVTAFLDFFGNWDPSLAFVMIGAIAVYAIFYRVIHKRATPLFTSAFSVPTRSDIDPRLIGGAALFGIGWGLAGFCPGPAVTSLASGQTVVISFVAAMIAGMYLYKWVDNMWLHRTSAPVQEPRLATPTTPAFHSPQDS